MIAVKVTILCGFVIASVQCVISMAAEVPLERISRQTAAKQQGSAVVFFAAHQGMTRELLFNPIIFNQVLVNQGSGYDNTSGVFTAPVDGIYQFLFSAQLCRGDHNNFWAFMVNGVETMLCHAQMSGGDTSLNTCFFIENLKKGYRVWIKQLEGSCAWSSATSKTITFSGVLLVREGVSMLGGRYGSGYSCPPPSLSRRQESSSAQQPVSLSCVVISLLVILFLLD
ncbi:uncharacterized protein LOC105925181 isoform X1 [Fundulus heteroclitus]|uniref:uncharacterized protein LOC105925181 isoform X1 n=1 Tax=Fundulus heteroclitus TaxID=8078 RepID=UPI00165C08E2|nr:uncharacterized protein LOC105925181 isoform X1 [Fundulus heteroclitus]